MWALRDCVVASGHGNSAREALNFYKSLEVEINRACDDGRVISARTRRDTMMPRWRAGQTHRISETAPGYIADFLLFSGFSAYPTESWGSAELLDLFRDLTRWRLAHSNEAPELDPTPSRLDYYRLAVLQILGEAVRWLCVAVVTSGLAAWTSAATLSIYRRRMSYLFVVSSAALGSAFAVLVVNMLVHVLAFRNRGPTALHEGYPLLILFGVTAWIAATWSNPPDYGPAGQSTRKM